MDVVAPVSAPGRLTIDLRALADNWRDLARRAAPGRCGAVLKANAYGTGVSEAAPALWAAGARVFFVAHFSEGIAVRRVLPAEAAIYVLNGLESGADPSDYAEHRLRPATAGGGRDLCPQRPRERRRPFGLCRASPRARDRRRRGVHTLVRLRRASGSDQSLRDPSRHRHEPARLRLPRPTEGGDGGAWREEGGR